MSKKLGVVRSSGGHYKGFAWWGDPVLVYRLREIIIKYPACRETRTISVGRVCDGQTHQEAPWQRYTPKPSYGDKAPRHRCRAGESTPPSFRCCGHRCHLLRTRVWLSRREGPQ